MHQYRGFDVSEEPRADSLPISRPIAVKIARKEMS